MERWEQGTRNRSGAKVRTFTGSDRLGVRLSCQKVVTHYYGVSSSCLVPLSPEEEGSVPTYDRRTGKTGAKYLDGRNKREAVRCAARSYAMPVANVDIWDDDDYYAELEAAYRDLQSGRKKKAAVPSKLQREKIQKRNLELMRQNQARKEAAREIRKNARLRDRVERIRSLSYRKAGESMISMQGGF